MCVSEKFNLVFHWTILTYQKINQILWHFSCYLSVSLYRHWMKFRFIYSWCLNKGYYYVKLNHKPEFNFIGKGQFDYEFLDLYICMIHISWYPSKTLKSSYIKKDNLWSNYLQLKKKIKEIIKGKKIGFSHKLGFFIKSWVQQLKTKSFYFLGYLSVISWFGDYLYIICWDISENYKKKINHNR